MECGEGVCIAMPVSGGSTAQDQKGDNWVELEYLDASDRPVGGAKYVVMDAEGKELATGTLDADGYAYVRGLPPDVHVIQFYFDDDPQEYEIAEQYKPKTNTQYVDEPGYWDKTKGYLSDAWDWTWGVFQGDFNEDPSISQIIARAVLTLIPIVDQIGDAQDIIAALKKLIFDKRYDEWSVWFDLVISLIGCIPEIGSVFKAITKAIKLEAKTLDMLKLLRRLNWAGSGNAFRFIKKLRTALPKYQADVTKKLGEVLGAVVSRLKSLRKWASTKIQARIDDLVAAVEHVRKLAPKKIGDVFDYIGKRLDAIIEGAKRLIKSGETRTSHTIRQDSEPLLDPKTSKGRQVKEDSIKREKKVEQKLKDRYPPPKYEVQNEQYLRDANGKIVKDPVTGEARRVDHVVIEDGKVVAMVETTSPNAKKTGQMDKESRIRAQGGGFIRRRNPKALIPIEDGVKTVIERVD